MDGFGENGLVVGSSKRRAIQKKQPRSKAWPPSLNAFLQLELLSFPCLFSKVKQSNNSGFLQTFVHLKAGSSHQQIMGGQQTQQLPVAAVPLRTYSIEYILEPSNATD
jgi:hypothetical protein